MKLERQNPSLKIGDDVRIMIKRTNKSKATDPRLTKQIYKIIDKTEIGYKLNESFQKKYYNRFELLKV